ncbi:hypothetical protein OG765_30565 [Streptomyces sp. NBC_00555]|uniref:hypothetical protein n=1 Tax=Streptomyces sp. NBC_00555 TaxID=2903662 RepID=UPI00225BF610|nr:hypothetical protein [Streptomyces sp. NBC_00555]MCX5015268.1 hypothetical protein [Streptomyces sp. NBC_00555]
MKLSEFDAVLSRRPFGDSRYVTEQMHSAFRRRLESISTSVPAARRLLTELQQAGPQTVYRILGDPLVRRCVQQLVAQAVVGRQQSVPAELCAQVLDATARHAQAGSATGPLQGSATDAWWLGEPSRTPWIWTGGRHNDIFGRVFEQFAERQFGAPLHAPTREDLAALQRGARLLEELLPMTSHGALSHAHQIGIHAGTGPWKGKASTSQFTLTGAIFLNRKLLKNPWWVAEHLLHEALHQKLYDFRHAHSLLARDLDEIPEDPSVEARRVVSLWNLPRRNKSNCWGTHRAMAAFHVYVHLALFCSLAERLAPQYLDAYGPVDAPRPMTPSRKAFERAHYLGESLRGVCWDELGLAGQRMVDWLSSILDAMDPTPPPAGSSLHLLLDRYVKEAHQLRKAPPSDDLAGVLKKLERAEAEAFRAVLSVVGMQAQLDDAAAVPAPAPQQVHDDHGAAFAQRRNHISETLLRLAPDGYSLDSLCQKNGTSADEMVRAMVESSSRELAAATA